MMRITKPSNIFINRVSPIERISVVKDKPEQLAGRKPQEKDNVKQPSALQKRVKPFSDLI